MEFTDNEVKEAQSFGEFYIDSMENHQNRMQYYFSEDITLDWFGQTVKGEKNVIGFFKKTLSSVNHIYAEFKPAKKIGFRDTHVVKVPRYVKTYFEFTLLIKKVVVNCSYCSWMYIQKLL